MHSQERALKEPSNQLQGADAILNSAANNWRLESPHHQFTAEQHRYFWTAVGVFLAAFFQDGFSNAERNMSPGS